MDAGGAIKFAALAEQARKTEMGVDGVSVDVETADKNVDRLVGLFVEQEVEAAHVVVGEAGHAMTMTLATAQPAHGVTNRYGEEKQGQPDWLLHSLLSQCPDQCWHTGGWRTGVARYLAQGLRFTSASRWRAPKPPSKPTSKPIPRVASTSMPSRTSNCMAGSTRLMFTGAGLASTSSSAAQNSSSARSSQRI